MSLFSRHNQISLAHNLAWLKSLLNQNWMLYCVIQIVFLLTDLSLWCSVLRLVCHTGRSLHDRTDSVRVDVDQSGTGTSKESFAYLVSILQHPTLLLGLCSPFCLWLPPYSSCMLFCFAPHWEGLPKSVSWVLTDVFYGSEECWCVGIFKRPSELKLKVIVMKFFFCQQKQILRLLECPFYSEFISGWGKPGQCCGN